MSHMTPTIYLVWAILTSVLGAFLFFHLWKFDRFKCLKLSNGPYAGAFKRLMTYAYLFSVPGIIAYSIGFAVIKYKEDYTEVPEFGIIPTPWQLWSEAHKAAILPMDLLFAISWSLEMVTHLEELCFWLFLVNSGSMQQNWFRSLYFKTWMVGSVVAITYMPLVTIFTRHDPLKCEAYIFLAGGLGSLSLTLWFLPILFTFPSFISNLKRSGVDIRTIVRLTTFHELNCIRICFRFLFCIPLIVLAVDGITPHQHVNHSAFWTEFLAIIASVGLVISSAITLVIFFPRSVEGEIQSRQATREKSQSRTARQSRNDESRNSYGEGESYPPVAQKRLSGLSTTSPVREYPPTINDDYVPLKGLPLEPQSPQSAVSPSPVFLPNRRVASGVVLEGRVMQPSPTGLTERALAAHDGNHSGVHPFLQNFTSPIDIMDERPKKWYVKRQPGAYAV